MNPLDPIEAQTFVDAAFPLRGQSIPIDHGYPLFAALSRVLPHLHEHTDWAVHPVRGAYQGQGVLSLTRHSQVRLRLPANDISQILALGGRPLDIAGNPVTLGFPRIVPLITAPQVQSRLVAIKNSGPTPDEFSAALARQLGHIGDSLGQAPESIEVQVGPRRVLRVKGTTIAGHAVALTGLHAQASLILQCRGLGGRRHMGAGVFVPPRRSA